MKLPRALTPHRVNVERFQGAGTYGETWAAPAELRAVKVEETGTVHRQADGTELVSVATVYVRPEHRPIPLQSRITLPSGAVGTVVKVTDLNHPPAPDYTAVYLA